MEENELRNIWKAYDVKVEKSLQINYKILETIQSQHVRSMFTPLLGFKIVELIIGVLIMIFLGNFLYANLSVNYFVAASGILMIFCLLAIIGSIKGIYLISKIGYDSSVLDSQRKITLLESTTRLQGSIIRYLRLAILSVPFYMAYVVVGFKAILDLDIVKYGDNLWWTVQIIVSILFIPLSIWLYMKISNKNLHMNWVRNLIEFGGGKSTAKAMDFINELEHFEKGV